MTKNKQTMALAMILFTLLAQGCAQYEKAPKAPETQTETRGITGMDEVHGIAPILDSQEER